MSRFIYPYHDVFTMFVILNKLKGENLLTACYLFVRLSINPEDGGSTFHRNVGKLPPDYRASHPVINYFQMKEIYCDV
jgi:hypothetical protein